MMTRFGFLVAVLTTMLVTGSPYHNGEFEEVEQLPLLDVKLSTQYYKEACDAWNRGKRGDIPQHLACHRENLERCRPDILLAGMPKCGTSSLFYALISHSSGKIQRPRGKEPDFFVTNSDVVVTPNFGYKTNDPGIASRYLSNLWGMVRAGQKDGPGPNLEGQLLLDSQPRTLQGGKRSAATALKLCPKSKILLVSCDPVRRAHTHYSYRALGHGLFSWQSHIYKGTTFDETVAKQLNEMPQVIRDLPPLYAAAEKATGSEKERLEGRILNAERAAAEIIDNEDSAGITTFVSLGLYALALRPWFDRFPESQFHVISLEEFATDPSAVMRGMETFLGLENQDMAEKRLHTKHNRNSKKSPFSESTLKKLREFYRPFNKRLEQVAQGTSPNFNSDRWLGIDMT